MSRRYSFACVVSGRFGRILGVRMLCRVGQLIPVIAGLLLAAGPAGAAGSGDVKTGKLVYQRYCLSCHGAQGNGQGEAAEYMSVKPRDYRQGTYKWRSYAVRLPADSIPTSNTRLINGLYGTYMPTWRALDERSRRDVIAYIKTFSPRFATEKPQDPIVIPPDPGYSDAVRHARRGGVQEVQLLTVSWRRWARRRSFRA